jgi:hypothetical protein
MGETTGGSSPAWPGGIGNTGVFNLTEVTPPLSKSLIQRIVLNK